MNNKLVLGYWAFRGRAQTIRYLLEYLELPYTEKRYTKREQWFEGDFQAQPFSDHIICNLPYLIDGDEYVYETGAILIYLIHKAGRLDLFGNTDEEKIESMQLRGVIHDAATVLREYMKMAEADRKGYLENNLEWLLQRIDRQIEGRKFIVGDNFHYIDFNLFEVVSMLFYYDSKIIEKYKNLVKHHANVAEIPQIKAYLQSDRYIPKPFVPEPQKQ